TAVADEDGDPSDGHFRATLSADGQYYAQGESGALIHGGHRYLLSDTGVRWTAAEAYAQSLGGHLVNIGDAAEQQWLTQNFGVLGVFWIGLTDQAVEGTWAWAGDGEASYTNWAPGQPQNQGDPSWDYAYMNSDGRW